MSGDHRLFGPDPQPQTFGVADDNLENFLQNWEHYKDRLMIFLGAGASIGAKDQLGRPLPTAIVLRNELWCKFMLSADERIDPSELGLLSLEHAAALIESKVGRGPLVEYIGQRFTIDAPLWPHSVLPFFKPRALYTTNYDELIEEGWRLGPDPRRPWQIYDERQIKAKQGPIPVYKPHGTAELVRGRVGEGGVVITQFDYFEMLESKRKMLRSFLEEMQGNCIIFIGYSFQDMDVASILHSMRQENSERHWYAVFPRSDPNVRKMYEREYGIRQINRTFVDFVAEVGQRLKIVPDNWQKNLTLAPTKQLKGD